MVLERLREMRQDRDMTQEQIAKYLHCSQVAYSYYESGKRAIPTELLIRLASYYNCSVDYLLNCTNIKKRYPKDRK